MAKYGIQKLIQNDLQQCINSYKRIRNGGIGIADELVYDTCKRALKYIDELEAKLADAVPVVRCKDCKYLLRNYPDRGMLSCGYYPFARRRTFLDDSCNHGEKRN